MLRLARLVIVLLLALTLVACGENAASATGSTENCRATGRNGTCEGALRTVRGPYNYRIETELLPRDTPVFVRVQLAVESGAMQVSLTAVDGHVVAAIARPGEPVDLEGYSFVGAFESIAVGMHVVEGEEVAGVAYTVTWQAD